MFTPTFLQPLCLSDLCVILSANGDNLATPAMWFYKVQGASEQVKNVDITASENAKKSIGSYCFPIFAKMEAYW